MTALAPAIKLYALTSLQTRMLRASQRAPESGVYIVQDICELPDVPDCARLRQAWQRVAERHPALRTRLEIAPDNEFRQYFAACSEAPWQELDWSDIPADSRAAELAEFLRADQERGFAFEQSSLMRFAAIRCAEPPHLLVWTTHHVLRDGRSSNIVWREWFAFYDALGRGEELDLPPAPPYARHLAWLDCQDPAHGESHWAAMFAGFAHHSEAFVDRVRQASAAPETSRCSQARA